ncbi:MAG TPA: glycosyltransferase [Firmicutes bacterium]|nr:glycosyltransferase [Bacillota bacterium]
MSLVDLIDIGPIFEAVGYAEVNRNIVLHLHKLGVDIRVKPKPLGPVHVDLDPATRAILEKMVRNVRITRAPALFVFLGGFFEREPGCYSIGLTMLETDRIPQDWVARCNLMDEVWVPSTFNRETFISSGVEEAKVRVMPLGVDKNRFHPGVSPMPIPGRRGFAFLSVFEWIPRKGYDILLRAYLEEFRPDEDVCLILRVHDNSAYDPAGSRIKSEIFAFQRAAGKEAGPPILVIPSVMSASDIPRLYAAADCFVLPTRGEGWNMTAIEAMACGLPTICTGWSSHLDFMTRETSLLVDVECLEPVPAFGIPNDKVYAGSRWARPSVAHLRALMRWVYENRSKAKEIGMRGCRDVLQRFTWEKAATRMFARLQEIQGNEPGGPRPQGPALRPVLPGGPIPASMPGPAASRRRAGAGGGMSFPRGVSVELGSGEGRPGTVLMVAPSLGKPCGISDYTMSLVEHLRRCGVSATVAGPGWREAVLASITKSAAAGGSLGHSPQTHGGDLGGRIDIVHFQYEFVLYDFNELTSTVAALRAAGVPVVATAHDFVPGLWRYNEVVARLFSRIIVHSQKAHDAYCGAGADPARVVVIPMGCTRYELDGEAPDIGSRPAVGFFGFCLPHKGMIELAMAAQEVRRSYPGLRCFMLSSVAPYPSSRAFATTLVETMDRLGLAESVTLIGDYLPEREVVRFLHAMDVNVLPYRDHGLIGTSAAARTVMAARKPMIVTDVPFFSDLGPEVYKIPSADPGEIAKALRRVLSDPELRAELVQRMDEYLERNDWSVAAMRHAAMYKQVLQEATPRGMAEVSSRVP